MLKSNIVLIIILRIDTSRPHRYDPRPMKEERLPISIDPVRFAKTSRVCRSQIKISELPRVMESYPKEKEEVLDVVMKFLLDQDDRVVIEIEVKTVLKLVCQRCLTSFDFPVVAQHALTPVKSFEEAEALPEELDPCWLQEGGVISPLELVEEELLLAIPLVPMHNESECDNSKFLGLLALEAEKASKQDGLERMANPFAVLERLKK